MWWAGKGRGGGVHVHVVCACTGASGYIQVAAYGLACVVVAEGWGS